MTTYIRSQHPQYVACYALLRAQNADAVIELLEADKSLARATDLDHNWTLLHVAAYHGSELVAKALLAAGADINAVDYNGETPMHLTAKWPHDKVAARLVDSGSCDLHVRNKRQRTALHNAALFQRRGVLEILLRAGADVNAQDATGDTPLHLALRNNGGVEPEVGRLLLRCKPKLHLLNDKGQAALKDLPNPQEAVFYAVNEGLSEMMEVLVQRGAKVDVVDADGLTLLQRAAFRGDAPMVKVLLAAGAKPHQQVEGKWAPSPGAVDLTYGPPATAAQSRAPMGDRSALHFAAERGNKEVLEALIAGGAKVNNVSNAGMISPLHIAVWTGQTESVRVLLTHKADVKARVSKNGMTPLHFAVSSMLSRLELIDLLVKAGADVEDRCSENWTPLMLACRGAPAAVVEYLLQQGARLGAKGQRGLTAVDCAEGRQDVLKILAAHCQAKGLTDLIPKIKAAEQRLKRYGGAQTTFLTPPDAGIGVTGTTADGRTIPLSLTGGRVENGSLVLGLAVHSGASEAQGSGTSAVAGDSGEAGDAGDAAAAAAGAPMSAMAHLALQQRQLSQLLASLAMPRSTRSYATFSTASGAGFGSAPSATVTVEPSTSTSESGAATTSRTSSGAAAAPATAAPSRNSATIDLLNLLGLSSGHGTAPRARGQRLRSKPALCALSSSTGCKGKTALVGGINVRCQQDPSGGQITDSDRVVTLSCSQQCVLKFHAACWKEARERLKTARPSFTISQTAENVPCIKEGCTGVLTEVTMTGLPSPLYSFKAPEGAVQPAASVQGDRSNRSSPRPRTAQASVEVIEQERPSSPPVEVQEASTSSDPVATAGSTGMRRARKAKASAAAPAGPIEQDPASNTLPEGSRTSTGNQAGVAMVVASAAVVPAAAQRQPAQNGELKQKDSKGGKASKDGVTEDAGPRESDNMTSSTPTHHTSTSSKPHAQPLQAGKAGRKESVKPQGQGGEGDGAGDVRHAAHKQPHGLPTPAAPADTTSAVQQQQKTRAASPPKAASAAAPPANQAQTALPDRSHAQDAASAQGAALEQSDGTAAATQRQDSPGASDGRELVQTLKSQVPGSVQEQPSSPSSPPPTPSAPAGVPLVQQPSPPPAPAPLEPTALLSAPLPALPQLPLSAAGPVHEVQLASDAETDTHLPAAILLSPAVPTQARSTTLPLEAPAPALAPAPAPSPAPAPALVAVPPSSMEVLLPAPVPVPVPVLKQPAAGAPVHMPSALTSDDRLHAAVQLLRLPPGQLTHHVLLQCVDIALIARTPGMMDAWLAEHVGKCCGGLDAYRVLGSYGMVAVAFESPAVAAAVLHKLHGAPMLMSPIDAQPLAAFPDNAVLVQAAQQVAMQVGGEGWLDMFTADCQHLKTLPAAIVCRAAPSLHV